MPIYQLRCPQCGHRFSGMVFAGTRMPDQWPCPECTEDAKLMENCPPVAHPLEATHGSGCPCCAGSGPDDAKS